MNDFKIGQTMIGKSHKPYIIAEMSGNHNQSLETAFQIIKAAALAGVSALKLQTYTADTMTLDLDHDEFAIHDQQSLWNGETLYNLYKQAYTPWEWHEPIFKLCEELKITCFSSPFDDKAVDFLETLDVPCYKIASFENTDLPLIRKVASTGKPMIISTGMASLSELDETVRTAKAAGCKDLILLKCTSTYPAAPTHSNLLTIPHMMNLFDTQVGLSDHTLGMGTAVASIALGATVIEKHFTLNRSDGGVDSAFSLEPEEMKNLVTESERAWQSLGKVSYGAIGSEKKSLKFRRSLYITEDMRAGDTFTTANLRCIRPGFGLPPKYYEMFLDKRIKKDVKKGTPLSWELLF